MSARPHDARSHDTLRRWGFAILTCLCALLPQHAHAGDPEAHTAAMIRAAKVSKGKPEFSSGAGAPIRNGAPAMGKFQLFTDGSEACPYTPANPYGVGCAYASIAGQAINEPDDWSCQDPRQPEKMNWRNTLFAPSQTALATLLSARVSEVAMVCNWNHFTSNPAIDVGANNDANGAFKLTRERAGELLEAIERDGATDAARCDLATWEKYYRWTLNSLHYVQDKACEHHDVGNVVCTNTDVIPIFGISPLHNYQKADECMTWLATNIRSATGSNPVTWCDEAFVRGPRTNIGVNANMVKVGVMCGFAPTLYNLEAGINVTDPLSWDPVLSLACMGMERTFRHHCAVGASKSLKCSGPGSDHEGVTSTEAYCEGERFSGGGQDFLTAAVDATVPPFEEAMRKWATVCKEPDDPCDADQCKAWCHRTRGRKVDGGEITGYCLNRGAPDAMCDLHECLCAFVDDCGARGKQCCQTATPCTSADDECGPSTGTCVAKETGSCTPRFSIEILSVPPEVPTDNTLGVTAHIKEAVPAGSTITWIWSHSGAGSIGTASNGAPNTNVVFNSGPTEGRATFTVSATIVAPGAGTVRLRPVTRSTQVKRGLRQIVMEARGGTFACSDPRACGVSEYSAFIVPRLSKATGYSAVLSGFAYPPCNRTVVWSSPVRDGGNCNFPVTYHPHNSMGATDAWAVWVGFGGPFGGGSEKCVVTITLGP